MDPKVGAIMQAIPILFIVGVGIYRLGRWFHGELKKNGKEKV